MHGRTSRAFQPALILLENIRKRSHIAVLSVDPNDLESAHHASVSHSDSWTVTHRRTIDWTRRAALPHSEFRRNLLRWWVIASLGFLFVDREQTEWLAEKRKALKHGQIIATEILHALETLTIWTGPRVALPCCSLSITFASSNLFAFHLLFLQTAINDNELRWLGHKLQECDHFLSMVKFDVPNVDFSVREQDSEGNSEDKRSSSQSQEQKHVRLCEPVWPSRRRWQAAVLGGTNIKGTFQDSADADYNIQDALTLEINSQRSQREIGERSTMTA